MMQFHRVVTNVQKQGGGGGGGEREKSYSPMLLYQTPPPPPPGALPLISPSAESDFWPTMLSREQRCYNWKVWSWRGWLPWWDTGFATWVAHQWPPTHDDEKVSHLLKRMESQRGESNQRRPLTSLTPNYHWAKSTHPYLWVIGLPCHKAVAKRPVTGAALLMIPKTSSKAIYAKKNKKKRTSNCKSAHLGDPTAV